MFYSRPLRTKLVTLLLVVFTGSVFLPATTFAIGVSPGTLNLDDVLPGSRVPVRTTVTRFSAEEDEVISLTPTGELKDHIELPEGTVFTMKKGVHQLGITIYFNAGDLATGEYTSHVRIAQTKPSNNTDNTQKLAKRVRRTVDSAPVEPVQTGIPVGSAGSTNLSAAQLDINVHITNNVVSKWRVESVEIRDLEEDTPLVFTYNLENQGNSTIKPHKIKLSVTVKGDPDFLYQQEYTQEQLEFTKAFERGQYNLLTDLSPKKGLYYGLITFYDDEGNEVYTSQQLTFRVVEEGTLAQLAQITAVGFDREGEPALYQPGETVIAHSTLQNTGEAGLKSQGTFEIYKDGVRLEILKSNEAFLPIGQSADFEVTYSPAQPGTYTVKSYYIYGIKRTETLQADFKVAGLEEDTVLYLLIGGSFLLLLIIILFLLFRRKKSDPLMPLFCPWPPVSPIAPAPNTLALPVQQVVSAPTPVVTPAAPVPAPQPAETLISPPPAPQQIQPSQIPSSQTLPALPPTPETPIPPTPPVPPAA